MHTFGNICDFLESGIWKSGNLEIAWKWLVLTNFTVLGIFPTQFLSLNLILCSEIQNSSFFEIWNLEIWKLPGICCFGPITTYWLSFPLIFSHWNWFWAQNFKIPVFLKSGIWKSGSCLEFVGLGQFQHTGYHSHSVLIAEIDFELRISKIPVFQKFFQKFSGNVEIFWNLLFRANSNILSIISTRFWSLKSIFNSEFRNSVSPENFPQFGYHFHSVLVTEINFEFKKNTVDGLELARIGLK